MLPVMSGAAQKFVRHDEATVADLLALPDQDHRDEIFDGRLPGGWWFATEVLIDVGPKQQ